MAHPIDGSSLAGEPAAPATAALARQGGGLPTEAEIVSSWPAGESPLVTIVCTTFNHARYVAQAIAGFLAQKTRFPFDVLIHDDASTDGTREIVTAYASRYPRLIRTVLQTTNQHSLGVTSAIVAIQAATAPLLAFCEGDDHWIDPSKLERQCEYLLAHPSTALVFHNALVHFESRPEHDEIFCELDKATFTLDDVILRDWFIPSQSMVFRRELLELPSWLHKVFGLDFAMHLFLASRGEVHYIDRVMGVYRVNDGSMTSGRPPAFFHTAIIKTLCCFDLHSGFKHEELIAERLRREQELIYIGHLRYRPRHVRLASADYLRYWLRQALQRRRRRRLAARLKP